MLSFSPLLFPYIDFHERLNLLSLIFARQSLCFPFELCASNRYAEGQNWSSRICLTFDRWVCGNNFKWNLFCSIYEFSNLYLTVCELFNYCSCWEEQSFCHCIHHDECAMYDGNVIYAVVQEIAGSSGLHPRASEITLDSTSFRSLIVFLFLFLWYQLQTSIEERYVWIFLFFEILVQCRAILPILLTCASSLVWYLKFVFNFITQDFPDIHYTEWNILYPEGHIAF